MELERIQRRATKFVLSLPFQTDMPYKTRLAALKMLPLCYWHEYIDILFLFKCKHGLVKTDILPEEVDTLTSTMNNYFLKSERYVIRTVILYEYRVCGTAYQMSYGNQNYHFRALNHVL
jgi:hypothetical protein